MHFEAVVNCKRNRAGGNAELLGSVVTAWLTSRKEVSYHLSQSLSCVKNQSFRITTHRSAPGPSYVCPVFQFEHNQDFRAGAAKGLLSKTSQ